MKTIVSETLAATFVVAFIVTLTLTALALTEPATAARPSTDTEMMAGDSLAHDFGFMIGAKDE